MKAPMLSPSKNNAKCSRGHRAKPKNSPRNVLRIVFDRNGQRGVGIGSGWLPVAWGMECLLVGNNGMNASPEGNQGGWQRKSAKPLTPSRAGGIIGGPASGLRALPAVLLRDTAAGNPKSTLLPLIGSPRPPGPSIGLRSALGTSRHLR
eukprot:7493033-Pyramimonas_sp.AAC.1